MESILLVDDDYGPRRTLAMVVTQAGYRVLEASDGAEGLALAAREHPDLVLLDLRLPDVEGTALLERFSELDEELPVVVITAYATVQTAVEALNRGAAAYAQKPLALDELLVEVRRLLERRRFRLENRRLMREMSLELEQRRRAEAARDLLSGVVEAASEAIAVTDPSLVVVYCNRAFERLTGRATEEVVGTALTEVAAGLEGCAEAAGEGRTVSGVLEGRRAEGERFDAEYTATSMTDERGGVLYHVFLLREITEQRRLEAVARAADVASNVGYVFSGVRHELSNPLSALRIIFEVIEQRLDQGDLRAVRARLALARGELARVQDLLESLRSFSLHERLAPRALELGPFLDRFCRLVRDDCEARGVALGAPAGADELLVLADPRALHQVMLNLLTNALDALAGQTEGPAISFEIGHEGDRVTIGVCDNGRGFTAEAEANLFRPFVTTKPHGTGLGLVIARKMMTEMGGDIDLSSRDGGGTRVELKLAGGRRDS